MYDLDDEVIQLILSFLDAPSLAKIMCVSRYFYVHSNSTDLWRDLVLLLCVVRQKSVEFTVSWRDTYAILSSSSSSSSSLKALKPHSPIIIENFYSKTLYRPWACTAYDLEASFPKFFSGNNITRIEASSLTYESFFSNFESKNIPLVITNGIADWPALSKWTDDYLSSSCEGSFFRATSAMASSTASFAMKDYLSYSKQCREEVPLYLFERNFCAHPKLAKDFFVPSFFDSSLHPSTDLFRLLGSSRRPDFRWLIVGPKKSGSIFHIDPNMTHAWNAVIRGRKKWIFYPPLISPPVSSASSLSSICMFLLLLPHIILFWAMMKN